MKSITSLFAFLALAGSAAASVTYTFDSAPYVVGDDVNGVDGWVVSDTAANLAFTTEIDPGNNGLVLGGFSASPDGSFPVTLSHSTPTTSLDTGTTFTQVSFQFALIDSDNSFPDRDTFSFSLLSSTSSSLVTLSLIPVSQSADPEGTTGTWALAYDFNDGTGLHTSAYTIDENGLAKITISFFGQNGVYIDFGGPEKFYGTPTGYSGLASLGEFDVTWSAAGGGGDNVVLVDNVTFASVPEPSAALLGGIGALGLLRRRRA